MGEIKLSGELESGGGRHHIRPHDPGRPLRKHAAEQTHALRRSQLRDWENEFPEAPQPEDPKSRISLGCLREAGMKRRVSSREMRRQVGGGLQDPAGQVSFQGL